MHFAYVDDSGDAGPKGSKTFTLGCVLVEDAMWPSAFDDLISFRRFLRAQFGLPMRAEVKANHLIRGAGAFRRLNLSDAARFSIYRGHMRLQQKIGLRSFAVVINKAAAAKKVPGRDPREIAWEYLLQRLERFTTKGKTQILLVHDEGDPLMIRKLTRKARRAGSAGSMFGTGVLKRPASLILDDPVPRVSHQSYFLQMADLVAYAAYRRLHPPPIRAGRLVVPASMWDELGPARYAKVNAFSGGPPGIVSWP